MLTTFLLQIVLQYLDDSVDQKRVQRTGAHDSNQEKQDIQKFTKFHLPADLFAYWNEHVSQSSEIIVISDNNALTWFITFPFSEIP